MLCSNSVKIRYAFIAFIVMTVEAQISLYRLIVSIGDIRENAPIPTFEST